MGVEKFQEIPTTEIDIPEDEHSKSCPQLLMDIEFLEKPL